MSRNINYDVTVVTSFITSNLVNFILNILITCIILIYLFSIDKNLCFITISFSILYLVLYKVFKNKIYSTNLKLIESQSKFFSALFEQLRLIEFIRLNNIFSIFDSRLKNNFNMLYNNNLENKKVVYFFNATDKLLTIFVHASLIILGGSKIINNSISIGVFTVFISYFNYLLNSLKYFMGLGKSYQTTLASYNRICDIFGYDPEIDGDVFLESINSIAVKKNYSILNNLSSGNQEITFNKGNIYIITGKNGAGKSTVVKQIIGLYNNCEDDKIKYNGISKNKLNMAKIRDKHIALCEQIP